MFTRLPGRDLSRVLGRALTVTLGITLVAVMLAAAGHSHRDAQESTSCALCAIAHTPAIETTSAPTSPDLELRPATYVEAPARGAESPAPAGNPTRAPPLA